MSAAFLFFSCASNQKEIIKYHDLVLKKDFKTAIALLETGELYKDDQSRLLRYLEAGTLHFYNGEYYQALINFDLAHDLSEKLFTTSISKKLAGGILNESLDNYSGERFERSLIRYYQIISHYSLYEKGIYESYVEKMFNEKGEIISTKNIPEIILNEEKKRFHLTAANAVVLEWNSLLEDFKKTSPGEVTYKDDLLEKFVGAALHQKKETGPNRQIAVGLYKESRDTIFKYYNSYKSFNLKFRDFNKEYSNLPSMKIDVVQKNYIQATPLASDVLSYAATQVGKMSNRIEDNVFLIWHEGFISGKEIKKYEFPIALNSAYLSVGTPNDFIGFSTRVLVSVKNIVPKIYFELPKISFKANEEDFRLIIKKENKKILEKPALLVSPLSEMAFYTMDSQANLELVKKGARVAAKHLAALVAAYTTYNKLRDKLGEGIAFMSGLGAYNLASRGIAESEKADLRSWGTLPNQIRMNSFKLSPGDYDLYVLNLATNFEKYLGKLVVSKEEKTALKIFF